MNFNSVRRRAQGAAAKKRYHSRSCQQIALLKMNFQRGVKKKGGGGLPCSVSLGLSEYEVMQLLAQVFARRIN
jgi:hypothetical protein